MIIVKELQIKKEEKKIDTQKAEKNIKMSPIVGIITLEDLIETWLQIHILDEENYEENIRKARRKITI